MPFAAGTRLGRIRIDAMLGAGGMGEVYRGFDERLERTVAIKRIHPDRRLTAAMRARFLREARVLSKLDHPNICRIYDVLEREEGDCLVLELIEGTTLRDRVERGLPRPDAVAIALQIARVLEMAHGRDIIHRDLKPDNVMVTAANEVKVLDFGLARLIGGDDADEAAAAVDFTVDDVQKTAVLDDPEKTTDVDSAQTTAGSLVGTVHYMSPEQARGLPLSSASDIYSLGAVLYEMLSGGASPYGDVESQSQLLTRVRQGEILPRDFGDAELTRLITRMLSLHPTERPAAGEVVEALERVRTRPLRVRRQVIAAAAVLALLLAIGVSVVVARQLFGERKLFAKATGRVAVLPFRNETNDRSLAWVELGLTDLVAQSLGDTRGVDVVPTEDVSRALRNVGVNRNVELSDDHRRRLLEILGADVLIDAAVAANDGKYAIRYAAHGRDRTESPREVESTVVTEAAREMSLRLASRIDSAARSSAAQHYSLDHFANMAYAIGQHELTRRGPRVAASYFAVAVDRDPDFDWARLGLADCYNSLGQIAESDQLIETVLARARKQRNDALLAAALCEKANWVADRGDSAAVGKYAAEALAAAKRSGIAKWIVGAHNVVGMGAWRSGDFDRAQRAYEEALPIAIASRDLRWQARLHNNLGVIASERDDLPAARTQWTKAQGAAERLNDRYLQTTILGNLGLLAGDSGDLAGAEAMTRRQIELAREVGDRETEALALTNLGLWLYAQGKEDEGIAVTEQALGIAKLMGAKRYYALIASNLAQVQTRAGRLEVARAHAEDAIKVVGEISDPQTAAETQVAYAYYLTRAGRLAEAERALAAAKPHAPPLRHTVFAARLAYARGDYKRAAQLIEQARAVNDTWLNAYEVMRVAFRDMARQGATKIAFETPVAK